MLGSLLFYYTGFSKELEGMGTMDWQRWTLRATGVGLPDTSLPRPAQKENALERAERVVIDILMETLGRTNLTSDKTVADTLKADHLLATEVEKAIGKARRTDIRYMSDLSVEVDAEIDLIGPVLGLLIPQTGGGEPVTADTTRCPLCGQPWPSDRPFPKELFPLEVSKAQTYTGLIIDARGSGLQPAIAPKVLNEQNQQVYGPAFVERKYAISRGIVGYMRDLEGALRSKRVGDKPLVIKALRVSGPKRTDVVIPNAQALVLHNIKKNLSFLRQSKVIMVID